MRQRLLRYARSGRICTCSVSVLCILTLGLARLLGFAETIRGAIITQDEYVTPSKYEVYDRLLVTLPSQPLPT